MSQLQSLLSSLNDPQRAAAKCLDHTLVVACPGSGKTRVLQTKALYLLETFPDIAVCAVTFTRDSAKEIAKRIADASPTPFGARLITGTFHSIAWRQLRKHNPGLRLLGPADQRSLLARARKAVAPKVPIEECQQALEHMKSSLEPQPRSTHQFLDTAIYDHYQRNLINHRAIDFADILALTVRALRAGDMSPMRIGYMLVDEFQDADAIQHEWIDHHSSAGAKTTVVGDDDQCIFGWRHARGYTGMMAFQSKCQAKVFTLDTNYRCRAEILTPSAALISHNVERMPKLLLSAKGKGGTTEILRFVKPEDEILSIANTVSNEPDTWAVIARTNILLDDVEVMLRKQGIPYTRVGSGSMWSTPPVQAFLMTLTSIADHTTLGLEHTLSFVGGTEEDIAAINEAEAFTNPIIPSGITPPAAAFLTQLKTWREQAARGNYPALFLSLKRYLLPAINPKKHDYFARAVELFGSFRGTLHERLRLVMQPPEKDADSKGVTLTTMHASKGLEWDRVIVVRANVGVIPSAKSVDLCEERRLLYVAFTRARERLVASFVCQAQPSPFLHEAGVRIADV